MSVNSPSWVMLGVDCSQSCEEDEWRWPDMLKGSSDWIHPTGSTRDAPKNTAEKILACCGESPPAQAHFRCHQIWTYSEWESGLKVSKHNIWIIVQTQKMLQWDDEQMLSRVRSGTNVSSDILQKNKLKKKPFKNCFKRKTTCLQHECSMNVAWMYAYWLNK